MKMRTALLTFCAALVALFTADTTATAQNCREITLANGTRVNCVLVNGRKVYVDEAGNEYDLTSTGNATFQATGNKSCVQTLAPTSLSATGSNPILGTVTTTLDATRVSPASSISPATDAFAFPALATINFYANATVSTRPGVVYRSIQPLNLTSAIGSFNPFTGEVFTLGGSVQFEDVRQPGRVAFTLKELSVTLN